MTPTIKPTTIAERIPILSPTLGSRSGGDGIASLGPVYPCGRPIGDPVDKESGKILAHPNQRQHDSGGPNLASMDRDERGRLRIRGPMGIPIGVGDGHPDPV